MRGAEQERVTAEHPDHAVDQGYLPICRLCIEERLDAANVGQEPGQTYVRRTSEQPPRVRATTEPDAPEFDMSALAVDEWYAVTISIRPGEPATMECRPMNPELPPVTLEAAEAS